MSLPEEKIRRVRRPKPRHWQTIIGSIEENARILSRIPQAEMVSQRMMELTDELTRALSNSQAEEEE